MSPSALQSNRGEASQEGREVRAFPQFHAEHATTAAVATSRALCGIKINLVLEPPRTAVLKISRESKFKNVVGTRVRTARLAMSPKVSQDDLAGKLARLGVQINQAAISRIENRTRIVMDFEAQALAKALKKPISWLFGEV